MSAQQPSAVLVKTWDINRATGGDVVDSQGNPTPTSAAAAQNPTVLRLRTVNGADSLWFAISKGATDPTKDILPELGMIDPSTGTFTRWDVYDRRIGGTGSLVNNVTKSTQPPLGLAIDTNGDVWMTGRGGKTSVVRKRNGADTAISYRPLDASNNYMPWDARGITVLATNSDPVFVAEDQYGTDRIIELPVAAPAAGATGLDSVNGWDISVKNADGSAAPLILSTGPNLASDSINTQYIWFTEPTRNAIARLDRSIAAPSTTNPNVTEWILPSGYLSPIDIKVRTDGVWFTVAGDNNTADGAIGRLTLPTATSTSGTFQFYRRGSSTVPELFMPQLIALATSTDLWFAEAGTNTLTFLRPSAATTTTDCGASGCTATGQRRVAARVTQSFEIEANTIDKQVIDMNNPPYAAPPVDTQTTLSGFANNGQTAFAVPPDPAPHPVGASGEAEPFSIEIAPGSPLRIFATERFESNPPVDNRAPRQRGKVILATVTSISTGLTVTCSNQTFYTVNGSATVLLAPPAVAGGSGSYTYAATNTVSGATIGTPAGGGAISAPLTAGTTTTITETVTDTVNTSAMGTCTLTAKLVSVPKLTVATPANVTAIADSASGASNVTLPALTISGGTPAATAPAYTVSYSPAGPSFPNGTTTVTAMVSDAGTGTDGGATPPQQTTSVLFTVKVIPKLAATAQPLTVYTSASTGIAVTLPQPAITGGTGPYTVTFSPATGSVFPIGTTHVIATVTDSGGAFQQTTTAPFDVTVILSTPPQVTSITTTPATPVVADTVNGKVITYTVQTLPGTLPVASTSCTTSPTAGLVSGSTFPVGTTMLTCVAVDTAGVTSAPFTLAITVTPPANLPPVCTSAAANPSSIWPPNHKFVTVNIVGVTDPDHNPVAINVTSIQQNEPTLTPGSGKTSFDGIIQGASAQVRAERSGLLGGRLYFIGFTATDNKGASCSGTVQVVVPHDNDHDWDDTPIDLGFRFDSTVPGTPLVKLPSAFPFTR